MKHITKNFLTKNFVVCLLAIFCCFLWGSAFPSIKIGYQLFAISSNDTPSLIVFAGLRFFLAGLLVIFFESIRSGSFCLPKRTSLPSILKLCIVQTVLQHLLNYIGIANTSGVKASIITGSNVFLTILVTTLIFKQEKLTTPKILGCIFGFAGVVLINLNGTGIDGSMKLMGEGAVLGAALSWAFSSVMVKRFSTKESPILLSGYQFLFGGGILACIGFCFGGRMHIFSPMGLILILYLAFISAAAFTLWVILLKYNPITKVSIYGFMTPVFGVLLSAFFLNESNQAFGWQGIIALLLVCLGIIIVNKNNISITPPYRRQRL